MAEPETAPSPIKGPSTTGTQRRQQKAIPVTVLTGFLGAGKTTLLNRLLADPRLGDTAVLINEFGDIGLDHQLVRETRENTVLLNSGCLCCTVRGDLVNAMRELFWQRADQTVPFFKRLVIETTGLADPAPIIHTLMTEPTLGGRYRFDGIVTCVDAVNGPNQLDSQPEPVKQAAVADRLVVTKLDLVDENLRKDILARLDRLNPAAAKIDACEEDLDPELLFHAGLFRQDGKHPDVAAWLRAEAHTGPGDDHHHGHDHTHGHNHHHNHSHDVNRHDARIGSFSLEARDAIEWDKFVDWMEMLIATQGDNLLRIKGILEIAGEEKPLAVHGVQHLFHPPAPLPGWADGEPPSSKLVFITRDISRQAIAATFESFVGPLK